MAICNCNETVLENFGWTEKVDGARCNFCGNILGRASFASQDKKDVPVNEESDTSKHGVSRKSISGNYAKPASRVTISTIGMDSIISRMWIWIAIQAIFIGIWSGNAFSNFDGYENSFNFGSFILGTLVGFGAFAPLVFIVEAMREIIRSILSSKQV